MKKVLTLLTAILSVSLLLIACGNKQDKYADQGFMNDLSKGLEAIWSLSDSDPDNESKDFYKQLDKKELDSISSYSNKKFKNDKLHEHAIAYINALKKQKATLKYYGSDSFYDKWNKATSNRNAELLAINKIQKVKVPAKYKDYPEELKGSGKAQVEKNNQNKELSNLIKSINFEAQPKEYPEDTFTTYKAVVKNTTGKTIKNLGLIVKIIDKDDTTADTQYVNTENWENGDKVKLSFDTDAEVNQIKVSKDYVEFSK